MNDKQGFMDQAGKQDIANDAVVTHQARGQRRWVEVLKHRWPTALGVAVATLTFLGEEINVEFVSIVSAIIILMAAIYLGAAALERRRAAWVAFLVGFVVLAAGRLLDSSFGSSIVFLVGALAFFVLGVVRGQWRTGGGLPLQTIGMLGFGAIALLACAQRACRFVSLCRREPLGDGCNEATRPDIPHGARLCVKSNAPATQQPSCGKAERSSTWCTRRAITISRT